MTVPSIVLTEDSNAGYEMFEAIFQDEKVICEVQYMQWK